MFLFIGAHHLVVKLNYTTYLVNQEGALGVTISLLIKHGSTLNLILKRYSISQHSQFCAHFKYQHSYNDTGTVSTGCCLMYIFFTYRYIQNSL